MGLESMLSSRAALSVAAGIGRTLTPKAADRLAGLLGSYGASRTDADITRAVRLNLWVASGCSIQGEELDDVVRAVLTNAAKAQYELLRHVGDPDSILEIVDIQPSMQAMLDHAACDDEGTIIVGPHVGNFDLGLHALGHSGLCAQVLSVPDPTGSNERQNEMREEAGMLLTPASKESVAMAIKRLRAGGNVGTGVDRPIEAQHYLPRFFGRPAPLPVTHVRLAFKTGAATFLVAAHRTPEGRFDLHAEGPIYLSAEGEAEEATVREAERILQVAEDLILHDPRQWLMFYPVWPELTDEVP